MIAMLTEWLILAIIATPLQGQVSREQIADHQQAAQQAEARGDFTTAVREYELLAQWLPKSAELQSNLGVALYFHHDLGKAADVFRHAIALNGSLYTPHLFLGLTLAHLSRPDAAVVELKKAIAINDTDPLAHTWLGYSYTAQSRYEAAAEQLEMAAKKEPNDQDIGYVLGQCYLELGKAAITYLWEVAPDGGRTWQLAGEQFETQGSRDKALRAYLGALKRRPDIESLRAKILALDGSLPVPSQEVPSASARQQEDATYERAREYEQKARDAFERVSQADPDSYRAHQIQGDSYAAADRFDDAIKEYELVMQRKLDLPAIHGALCNAMARTGRIPEALKECEAEIGVTPYSAEAYVDAARVQLLAHDDTHAAVLLEKALKLDRPPIAVYKLLGKLYLSQQRYQEASKALSKYLAVETKDSSAYYLLARAYKYSGDAQGMNRAIADYKRTSDVFKNTSYAEQILDTARHKDEPIGEGDQK